MYFRGTMGFRQELYLLLTCSPPEDLSNVQRMVFRGVCLLQLIFPVNGSKLANHIANLFCYNGRRQRKKRQDYLKVQSMSMKVAVNAALNVCRDFSYHPMISLFQVELDPNSGIFITLNPAGKGYGGRQKLPDNLKQLFRPVAMSRPDNELIAEVIMFSEGFKEAKSLGRKLVAIFNLSK